MKIKYLFPILAFLLLASACDTTKKATSGNGKEDGKIELIFLQLNDVYEIAPLPGDNIGGLARVATIRKELLKENPNTFTIMAGDFLNPSLIGTMKYDGKRISGKQMVETMNAVGVDFVTFGNHEFDIKENELLERLIESEFEWICNNVRHKKAEGIVPFQTLVNDKLTNVPDDKVLNLTDADGTKIKVGLFGVCLPFNPQPWVHYDDVQFKAVEAVGKLKPVTDVIVAITHLNIAQDLELARLLPDMDLVLGGHDHDNMYHMVGNTPVAKADANAKTVYVHRMTYDTETKEVIVKSELIDINDTVEEDPIVKTTVDKWVSIADESFNKAGFDKNAQVYFAKEPLDGRESSIRNKETNLGVLIAKAMTAAVSTETDCALFNSGSVRVDDQLKGKVTEYDIIRTLPYGGGLVEVEMKPRLLKQILETGDGNKGAGGFLQRDKAEYQLEGKKWIINGKPLDFDRNYTVILTEFLMTGLESNLGFLNPDNIDIIKITRADKSDKSDMRNDIRIALINYLRSL